MHSNQVYHDEVAPTEQPCNQVLLQHNWQMDDGVSREEIATAIATAEEDLENFLGYPTAPRFYDHTVQAERSYRVGRWPAWALFNLPKGYVWSGGVLGKTLLDTPNITYSDQDTDTYNETATVVVTMDGLPDASEIMVFYPGKDADPTWQIRPITISISGDTATITFKREQCVREALQEQYNSEPVDGADDANFLTAVDVYRIYTDTSAQAVLFFQNGCASCNFAGDTDCALCSYSESEGCIEIVNNRQGMVTVNPGTYDGVWTYAAPDSCGTLRKVRLRYLAGALLDSTYKMQTRFEICVARLAMTKLERPICTCESIQNAFEYWTTDLALSVSEGGSSSIRGISPANLECPFGTTRAGIWVYNFLKSKDVVAGKHGQ